ncbi:MAG: hypothetical protein VB960_01255 [Pseudohongiellaceae bacterium]|jgi:hypothetical protein|tara:strand:- start:50 stop:421 length:372 start_codon:yes stop_codon:yes gene_type:complete
MDKQSLNTREELPDREPQNGNQHQSTLKKIFRARMRLIVCFWTLPVYVLAVWGLLNNQRGIEVFMYIYMAVWAGFAVDMARRRCPACGQQYFVKNILLNIVTRCCVACGLEEKAYDSSETELN